MSLGVVLPTYNGMPHVLTTLRSLLHQQVRLNRILVVDDASTDGTPDAVEALGSDRVQILRSPVNHGLVGNWNRALSLATDEYFLMPHQDDIYDPEYAGVLLDLIAAHPRAFIAHCAVRAIDANGLEINSPAERYKMRFWPPGPVYERSPAREVSVLGKGNYILMPSVLYRTAAVRAIGPFDPEYGFAADWEYWIRGLLAGFTICGTRGRHVSYRRHEGMATRRAEADLTRYEDELKVCDRIADLTGGQAEYGTIANALLSELATRLDQGDVSGASTLYRFAVARIPRFKASVRRVIARTALRAGRVGGRALKLGEALYMWAGLGGPGGGPEGPV